MIITVEHNTWVTKEQCSVQFRPGMVVPVIPVLKEVGSRSRQIFLSLSSFWSTQQVPSQNKSKQTNLVSQNIRKYSRKFLQRNCLCWALKKRKLVWMNNKRTGVIMQCPVWLDKQCGEREVRLGVPVRNQRCVSRPWAHGLLYVQCH